MSALPGGTVTFLLTDVEGSTRLWEKSGEAMRLAMTRHDDIVAGCLSAHRGLQVESGREGDSVMAVFGRASDAIACAIEMQDRFSHEPWPAGAILRMRIALNSGEAELRAGHYYGQAVYRTARLIACGHGGQVLVSQSTRDIGVDALLPGANLLDLGSHLLKDLERPEQVYQLVHPRLEADFPPLRSLDAHRHNLPAQASSFIGREQELAEVKRALAERRLLTLTGAGGSGKTRLALRAAADVIEDYPDGVWIVDLAPLADAQLVLPRIVRILGGREVPGRPLDESLAALIRGKKLLLILDNCEHLIATAATLAAAMLAADPRLRILATSREPLRIAGEAAWPVPPLSLGTEAVALFADRAQAVSPGFRLEEHRADVEEICRRLDGMPLAIELAAARTSLLSPAELLSRLSDRFLVLTSAQRSADSRHRTLRAAVDWSYDLLDDREKSLFRRLTVFAGGFSLEAAEAVCSNGAIQRADVLYALGRLVEQSLVIVSKQGRARAATRYGLLETLREYGRERLAGSHEAEAVRRRHAEHFLTLAEAAAAKLEGPERLEWLDRLDLDLDNLRAVFEETSGIDPETELRLAVALRGLWDAQGGYAEGRSRLTAALARSDAPTLLRARAKREAGFMAWAQGDQEAATQWCEESLELCRRLGDREEEGLSLQQLAQIAFQQENFDRARSLLKQGIRVATALRDRRLASLCKFRLGMIALFEGDLDGASRLLNQSLRAGRKTGYEEMVVMSLQVLGHVAIREARLDDARALLTESLITWRERGGPRQIASLLDAFALLAVAEGDASRAVQLADSADSLRSEILAAPSPVFQRDIMERLRPVRDGLGDLSTAGLAAPMTREAAVAFALREPYSKRLE